MNRIVPLFLLLLPAMGCAPSLSHSVPARTVDLAAHARRGELRLANRTVTELVDGDRRGARIGVQAGEGAAWIPGVELATGTIEVELRGKDVLQQSFLGIAFGGSTDSTYEAVYLRPFNFRAADPVRRVHAVQYVSEPLYHWDRLRAERPELFENPVDPAPDPNGWVPLRLVVEPTRVQIFVGEGAEPDLVVDRLRPTGGRRVGLWVGNVSDGDFAKLRITPSR